MPDARPSPRSWCVDPALFGHTALVVWQEAGTFNGRQDRATAQAQHTAVCTVRSYLTQRHMNEADLARALRCDTGDLNALLTGTNWATTRDLVGWAMRCGPAVIGGVADAVAGAGVPTGPTTTGTDQRLHGRYLTRANPFFHPAFRDWFDHLGPYPQMCEPFAGANTLPRMLEELGMDAVWANFDIKPLDPCVVARDTLADFPSGHDAVVTNPPYLARHFARRKGLDVDGLPWGPYNNLYQVAVDRCLANAGHVAAIIPESFMTTGLFTERLWAVVSLTADMFDDTATPTCLALWVPSPTQDFEVWRGARRLGGFSSLAAELPMPDAAERIAFNDPKGLIGLRAVDGSVGPSIGFVPAAEVPTSRVNNSSRLVTRIAVSGLAPRDVPTVLASANASLAAWRQSTGDVTLTAFKGLRADGEFRRRLDYESARRILGAAVDAL